VRVRLVSVETVKLSRTFSNCGDAMPTGIITTATTARATRARQRHARTAARRTPKASATKLDCEKEKSNPIQTKTIAAPSARSKIVPRRA
jgi:hypothetical protein